MQTAKSPDEPGQETVTGKGRQRNASAASAGQLHVAAPEAALGEGSSGFGLRLRYLDRAVYTTITIMGVLIVYDGWQNLKFWAYVGVIIGPELAMFISHVFSAFLARQAVLHERPGRGRKHHLWRAD